MTLAAPYIRDPTALNMGDCYAYACAKAREAKLLFKGDDFTKTDATPADRTAISS